MKHKWYKEIQAWSEGAEIEHRNIKCERDWIKVNHPTWADYMEYRIKPQPKEPKYLYVYADGVFFIHSQSPIGAPAHWQYIGKIEVQND